MNTRASGKRERIVQAAYEQFYARGFARVSMDEIAAAAGITKRTLYSYFPSKDDLAGAAAEQAQSLALAQFERWIHVLEGHATTAIPALFDKLETWVRRPHWAGSGFTRIAMELADLPGHPVRRAARAHKKTLEDTLASAFGDRAYARKLVLVLEGALTVFLVTGDPDVFRSAREIAASLQRAPDRS